MVVLNQRAGPLELCYQLLNHSGEDAPWLLLLHGMFGAGSNLRGIGRAFSDKQQVLLPDLRNHGQSPHSSEMDYRSMAGDVLALLERLGINHCAVVGHSMGGKVAMYLALSRPDVIRHLAVLDMAPVNYPPRFERLFTFMSELECQPLDSRRAARKWLEQRIEDHRLAGFLYQSIVEADKGITWRFNLSALRRNGDALRSFPEVAGQSRFRGPALFLHGERSDYLLPEYWPAIRSRFPLARGRKVKDAGHWLHADRPEVVIGLLRSEPDWGIVP